METIKLQVSGSQIQAVEQPAVITAGTVGLMAEFSFDSQWENLTKTAVFRAGDQVIATVLEQDTRQIPWEVLEKPNRWLSIGVYGANKAGSVVIPTVWAQVALVHTGVEPEGAPALDPTNPAWQEALTRLDSIAPQLQNHINNAAGDNPHNVTCEQLDAVPREEYERYYADITGRVTVNEWDIGDVRTAINEHMINLHGDNPHGVTCEQIGAIDREQHDIDVDSVREWAESELGLYYEAFEYDMAKHKQNASNPHSVTAEQVGAVAKEQHDFDIAEVNGRVDLVAGDARVAKENADALVTQFADHKDAANPHGVTAEMLGAATKEEAEALKAVIVTVDGSTPSHTSEDIFNTVLGGGSVYLKMWSGTYIRLSWCTADEAIFEASVINPITGADGKNYSAQNFRVYRVVGNKLNTNSVKVPEQAYVDAQIQYYLASKEE